MMGRFRMQGDEVPEGVVGGLSLRDLPVGVGLDGMDDVRELDPVLDEEDRHVVADEVEVALVRIELHRESANVAHRVGGTTRARDRREPNEDRCLAIPLGQEACAGRRGRVSVGAKHAVSGSAAGVDDPFGDPLVIEMRDLLAQMEVLEQ